MKRGHAFSTPPVTVRRWTGDKEHDRAQAWSHLTDEDLEQCIRTGRPTFSVAGSRAELKRRRS